MRAALLRRLREQDLPGLHHLLEVAQIVHHLLAWLLAEEHRDLGSELAERWLVLELDAHLRAAPARCALEAHAAGVVYVGVVVRSPRDEFVRPILGRLGFPLHRRTRRRFRLPVR